MTLEELERECLHEIAGWNNLHLEGRVDQSTVEDCTARERTILNLIDLAAQVDGLLSTAKRVTTKYRGEPDEDEWLISDDVLKELQKTYDELEGK
jgi:hypothetical protein